MIRTADGSPDESPVVYVTTAYAGNHISVYYVDTLGRVIQVYRDGGSGLFNLDNFGNTFSGGVLSNDWLGLGGRGTAPPGSPVSALCFPEASSGFTAVESRDHRPHRPAASLAMGRRHGLAKRSGGARLDSQHHPAEPDSDGERTRPRLRLAANADRDHVPHVAERL